MVVRFAKIYYLQQEIFHCKANKKDSVWVNKARGNKQEPKPQKEDVNKESFLYTNGKHRHEEDEFL